MDATRTKKSPVETWIMLGLLFFVAAAAYLPLINQFGYYRDDWSLIYAGHTQGAEKLIDIYSIDRPFIGFLFAGIYNLFGDSALPYNLAAFMIRFAGGLVFFWLLRLVWPRQRLSTFLTTLLFLVYPGFLQQPNGIQFQPHQLNMFASLLSIALTICAIQAKNKLVCWVLTAISLLASLWSLLMMEYFIGLEVLRLILLWYLAGINFPGFGRRRFRTVITQWAPYFLLIIGFLYWRSVIFVSSRPNTDIGSMLSKYVSDPVYQGSLTLAGWAKDFFEITFFSWVVPAYQHISAARLRDFWVSAAFGLTAALVTLWVLRMLAQNEKNHEENDRTNATAWGKDASWIGALAVLGASAPVIFSNRDVSFALSGDRFSLPASAGAALLITGLLFWLVNGQARRWIAALLVLVAVMTHYNSAMGFVNWWSAARNFWWQVSWRAPQIESGTTIFAQLPGFGIEEDYEIWGPANLIFYPQAGPLNLTAEVLYPGSIQGILMGTGSQRTMRTIEVKRDYAKALVLSMPSASSCVHAIDGRNPVFSSSEETRIMLIANKSQTGLILTDAIPQSPPVDIFGPDPGKNWCYFYEKAALAQEKGDWAEIVRLYDELTTQMRKPVDRVEWFPFIQALAYTGETDRARSLVPIIQEDAYLGFQACRFFKNESASPSYSNPNPEGLQFLIENFCSPSGN